MKLMELVKKVEGRSSEERGNAIQNVLREWDIACTVQRYATGRNIFVRERNRERYIGISCHFDVVPGSPGANDNGSSVAVCLELLARLKKKMFRDFGVIVFFFDEEETGLHGSAAYLEAYGHIDITGLMNLEMLGMGDRFALWSLNEQAAGRVLNAFEQVAAHNGIPCHRFDRIVTNIADHMSFRDAGLKDAFSITCISEKELEVAQLYYKAMSNKADMEQLRQIMRQAPLFVHYHRPTDKSEHLNERSLQMAADAVWSTLCNLDEKQ